MTHSLGDPFTTMEGNISCQILEEAVICNGIQYNLPEAKLNYHDTWFWIYLGIYAALVLFAGLCSGLTIGLLSLDMMSLQVLQEAGSPKERRYASRILPVVKRHHLLLVTLLLANAVCVEGMPLCLDRISDPITAIIVSVTAVLLFGEVFPQSLCSRYGLAIGANLVPLVYMLMGLLFIIAFPLAKLLDCLLGKEHTTFFRRAELKVLVDLHGPNRDLHGTEENLDETDNRLTTDEVMIIQGALEMKDKTAGTAMIPISKVFMIDSSAKLDKETTDKILASAHSRIPVHEPGNRNKILGIILVKTLIRIDPDDEVPVTKMMYDPVCSRKVLYVGENTPLYDVLNEFQTGKSHLFFVKKHISEEQSNEEEKEKGNSEQNILESDELVGIITMEDVIEELLQEEILDEADVYRDMWEKRLKLAKARRQSSFLRSSPPDGARNRSADDIRKQSKTRKQLRSISQPGDLNCGNTLSQTSVQEEEEDDPTTPLLQK